MVKAVNNIVETIDQKVFFAVLADAHSESGSNDLQFASTKNLQAIQLISGLQIVSCPPLGVPKDSADSRCENCGSLASHALEWEMLSSDILLVLLCAACFWLKS